MTMTISMKLDKNVQADKLLHATIRDSIDAISAADRADIVKDSSLGAWFGAFKMTGIATSDMIRAMIAWSEQATDIQKTIDHDSGTYAALRVAINKVGLANVYFQDYAARAIDRDDFFRPLFNTTNATGGGFAA